MHELVKNEKKKESRARPLLQTRTDPIALSTSAEEEQKEEQQKRIAARAAKAMAQVLQRRREPRSQMIWGDRKKAVIKRYPDGSQEIIVPQTLTPEQENYEFPPRSRFLKKLANSTAERRRISVLQDHLAPSAPDSIVSTEVTPAPSYQTINTSAEMRQPDQLALNEWFTKKENRTMSRKSDKDRAVIDWINDVERHSKSLLTADKKYQHLVVKKPSPSTSQNSNKIQFKSEAGKRWANSILSNASLLAPDDTCRKHYVPRRLLSSLRQQDFKTNDVDIGIEEENKQATEAASKIQMIWKEYQNKSSPAVLENQIGQTVMATTGQRTPIAGMVQLVQMLHHSLNVQRQKSHDRMAKLESLLKEETKKRQEAEENMKRLESIYGSTKPPTSSLLSRVTELELSVKRNSVKRQSPTSSTTSKKSTTLVATAHVPPSTKKPIITSRQRKSVVPELPLRSNPRSSNQIRSSSLAPAARALSSSRKNITTTRRLTVATPNTRRPVQ
ncbi:hypothetical protein CU098_006890 [Rhizopus stolonifer]|uniref:Uncharacterized protein n=1 Tax=Rhizopus stolonifer TaxID=4846 RepID=A0A367JA28_RHIST|nr:hypothetical protein CU098_006890 [Rhizopus stolonifer]